MNSGRYITLKLSLIFILVFPFMGCEKCDEETQVEEILIEEPIPVEEECLCFDGDWVIRLIMYPWEGVVDTTDFGQITWSFNLADSSLLVNNPSEFYLDSGNYDFELDEEESKLILYDQGDLIWSISGPPSFGIGLSGADSIPSMSLDHGFNTDGGPFVIFHRK